MIASLCHYIYVLLPLILHHTKKKKNFYNKADLVSGKYHLKLCILTEEFLTSH